MRLPYRHQFAAELARADARLRPTFWNGVRRFFHDPRPLHIEAASTDLACLRLQPLHLGPSRSHAAGVAAAGPGGHRNMCRTH